MKKIKKALLILCLLTCLIGAPSYASKFTSIYTGYDSILTQGATATLTATQMRGQINLVTGAYTLSLPTAAVGYNGVYIATTAAAFSLDVITATDISILNGVSLAAGNKVTTDGTINVTIHVVCTEIGYYRVTVVLGIASDGGA